MEVKINKLDHFGNGIGRINDKVVFVKRALKDEIVDIEITKDKKKFMEGVICDIKESSVDRTRSICPYYDKCGGCNFLHTTYDLEKNFKIEKANELIGNVNCFYETNDLNYRNKVTLHVKGDKLGFYREKTNEIVDINYCYLLNDKINNVIDKLNDYIKKNIHELKKVVIKTNGNNVLIDLTGFVTDDFFDEFNEIDTIIYNNELYKGDGYLEETIDDKKLIVSSNSFYQVNKKGLEAISKIIKNYLSNKKLDTVLDLYSGISTWGILVSNYVNKVISIEENSSATSDALVNKEINKLDNLEIINGRVEDYIDRFKNIDLIIIDPPRSGLDKKTKEYLRILKSKNIIYISCDMITLKRDLEELSDIYNVVEINLVDMFKKTYHVETVVILERK